MKNGLGLSTALPIHLLLFIIPHLPTPITAQKENLTAIVIENGILVENTILPLFDNTLKNATLVHFTKLIARIVGYPPQEEDDINKKGHFSNFVQAYHTTTPAVATWSQSKERYRITRASFLRVRAFQEDWDKIRDFAVNCRDAVNFAKAIREWDLPENKKEINHVLVECKSWYVINHLETPKFGERAYKAVYEAFDVLIAELYFSFEPMSYLDYDHFKVNVFYQMLNDTTDFHNDVTQAINVDFPDYIAEVRKNPERIPEADDLQEKLKEIKLRLTQSPYDKLYGDPQVIANRKFELVGWYDPIVYNLDTVSDDFNLSDWCTVSNGKAKNGWFIYRLDWDVNVYRFVDDFNAGVFEDFWECVTQVVFHSQGLKVAPSTNSAFDSAGVLVGDGEWDWETDSSVNAVQNMRLAWDLMGAVLEELKCYMKKTYYFDLRPKAIQDTQLDLEKGALFTGISRTIFFPCRIENDSDLVTQYCTRANHEICAPMTPLDPRQRTDSTYVHGGKSLMRPKWIFKYDEHEKKCVGRKDYIMKLYHCRCGFILDCGKDIGENITCQLQPNDLLRGQCRGSVGYPCKSLPLAPGKHDESCASGYCNMKKNSCEDSIVKYHHSYTDRGTVDMGSGLWMITFLLIVSHVPNC